MTEDDKPVTRKDLVELEGKIDHKFEAMSEQMRDIETAMLKAFHSYAQGVSAQLQKLTAGDSSADIRLTALESRVLELETRRRSL